VFDVDGRLLIRFPPNRVHILMVHYREEPGAEIGPRLP
jgi:hypothetical protein